VAPFRYAPKRVYPVRNNFTHLGPPGAEGAMEDTYRVLPHRDVIVDTEGYAHRPCGLPLTERDVKEANWCPHCGATINKAAKRRAEVARKYPPPH